MTEKTPLVVPALSSLRGSEKRAVTWCLRLCHTPGVGAVDRIFEVSRRETPIGREAADVGPAGWVLPDAGVSRLHAVLELDRTGDGLVLVDRGSTNGSWVNRRRVDQERLKPGDVLRLGASVMLVLRGEPPPPEADDLGLVGRTSEVAELRTLLRRAAPSTLPVLAMGATGTGKDLVARAVHARSGRTGPFVALNCAALPNTLVENALFGHRRGAYTDAVSDEGGAFTRAHGGTLFLDEIGEMPLDVQPKLLRALEEGEITPVGATRPTRVDVRIVAATNRPLLEAVRKGAFRDDLYARLAGIVVRMPSLSERKDDLLLLLARFMPPAGRAIPWSVDAVEALLCYDWPLNVREVRRLAERLPVLHPEATAFDVSMLDPEIQGAGAVADPDDGPAEPMDGPPSKEELIALLERCGGNVSRLATMVGRNRKQVYRWMDQHGLDRGSGR